jgi:hypothetical protein
MPNCWKPGLFACISLRSPMEMRMRLLKHWIAMPMLALLGGCASLPPPCLSPARTMASAEMIFGRNIGDRLGVSAAAFTRFVAREIAPRFPDGLTVIDAKGQWRDDKRGILVHEPSKVVLISFTDDVGKRASLAAIADAYKHAFRQQAVLTSVRSACVSY